MTSVHHAQVQHTQVDISKSSWLDHGLATGLRALTPKHLGETLRNLIGAILPYPFRLSFNPETLAGKIWSSLKAPAPLQALASKLGIPTANLNVGGKNVYSKTFEKVTPSTDLSKLTIPGYNKFEELNKDVKIACGDDRGLHEFTKKDVEKNYDQKGINLKFPHLALKKAMSEALPDHLKGAIGEDGIVDKKTGLVAKILLETGPYVPSGHQPKIHVVFGGTGSGIDKLDNFLDKKMMEAEQWTGNLTTSGVIGAHVPPSYRRAAEIVGALKEVVGQLNKNNLNVTLEVKGFSKGGGEASYAGIFHGVKTLSHCGTPLSPACQRSLGQQKINDAVKNDLIFNTSVEGDVVSHSTLANKLSTSWEFLTSLQTARRIGPGIRIHDHGEPISGINKLGLGSFTIHNKSMNIFDTISNNTNKYPTETKISNYDNVAIDLETNDSNETNNKKISEEDDIEGLDDVDLTDDPDEFKG
ncbi:hypothetical protein [uncultured Thiocystis sp.]|jgi:hypothetical protein|uniref:hypothetical protein n=1 Tax=uncultured Thiocystis sp. TaxID=1202134 RepID=UPI0025DCF3F8|nr:hypothetical protein [uncultured Thiocystis sp.]